MYLPLPHLVLLFSALSAPPLRPLRLGGEQALKYIHRIGAEHVEGAQRISN